MIHGWVSRSPNPTAQESRVMNDRIRSLFLCEETKYSVISEAQVIRLCVEPGSAPSLSWPESPRPRNRLDPRRDICIATISLNPPEKKKKIPLHLLTTRSRQSRRVRAIDISALDHLFNPTHKRLEYPQRPFHSMAASSLIFQ